MVWKTYTKLSDCKPGDKVIMAAVINTSDEFLKFLNGRDIYLGLQMEVKSVEQFDNSMVVSYNKHTSETLSALVCKRLLVDKVN